ncbi:ETC complex I subunit conserved region [Hoeflea sp. IMCC20628]|nr:ETC complex I subunit conserved region [Hoeflea sp. IMCC20628]
MKGNWGMTAKIYRPAKTAMQSGTAKTQDWVLEFEPEQPRTIDPIMGYTSSGDMKSQIHMSFETRELAVAYATRNGIPFRVIEPKESKRRRMAYADNFRFDRRMPWTH